MGQFDPFIGFPDFQGIQHLLDLRFQRSEFFFRRQEAEAVQVLPVPEEIPVGNLVPFLLPDVDPLPARKGPDGKPLDGDFLGLGFFFIAAPGQKQHHLLGLEGPGFLLAIGLHHGPVGHVDQEGVSPSRPHEDVFLFFPPGIDSLDLEPFRQRKGHIIPGILEGHRLLFLIPVFGQELCFQVLLPGGA